MAGIVGRAEPIRALELLLDQTMQGQGQALVLRGEAGIGKSVLLEHAVRAGRRRGMRVLGVVGVPAEVPVPFAGLDHLLRPPAVRWHEASRVLEPLRRAADMDPLNESVQAGLMTTLAAAGRRAEALRAYGVIRRRLSDELGIEPGPDLLTAHQRVVARSASR